MGKAKYTDFISYAIVVKAPNLRQRSAKSEICAKNRKISNRVYLLDYRLNWLAVSVAQVLIAINIESVRR